MATKRIRDLPSNTPTPGDVVAVDRPGGGTFRIPLGQAGGIPFLDVAGALAASDAHLNRGSVTSAVDWNTLTNAGTYEIASGAFGTGSANTPPAVTKQGHLLVLKTSGATTQVYVPKGNDPGIYWRQYAGGTWSSWATAGVMYGSNANGWYVRFPNGVQICMRQRLQLSFYNANHMTVTWTLPAAFVAADYVPLALYDYNTGDTDPYFVKSLQATNKFVTSVKIDLLSDGKFTSSDIRYVSVMAIGRWK